MSEEHHDDKQSAGTGEREGMSENPHSVNYERIADVPTDVLAHRFVGTLILCRGNLNEYEALTAHMIRELRGEPHPQPASSKAHETTGAPT